MIDTGSPGRDYSYAGTDCGWNVQTRSGDTAYSEMAHLWCETFGNKAYCTSGYAHCVAQPGAGLTNTATFQNMQDGVYWFGLALAPDPSYAWVFHTGYGRQYDGTKYFRRYALAVRPGDVAVAAVPVPQTYALLMLGLAGLAVTRRRPR